MFPDIPTVRHCLPHTYIYVVVWRSAWFDIAIHIIQHLMGWVFTSSEVPLTVASNYPGQMCIGLRGGCALWVMLVWVLDVDYGSCVCILACLVRRGVLMPVGS